MRRICALGVCVALGFAAGPATAAVDLLQRLVDEGILTEQERQELAKEKSDVTAAHKGKSLSWATQDGLFRAELYGYGQVRYTFEDKEEPRIPVPSRFSAPAWACGVTPSARTSSTSSSSTSTPGTRTAYRFSTGSWTTRRSRSSA